MATESVGILIEADDQASAKLQQVKRIREVGGRAKASSEFIGTLSNAMGNSQLGGYAGQLAQLTERVSAFSEVSKAGGAGAFAFKAGLVAAAGVVTYKVAESIASWWFEADRWKQAMADGAKEAAKAEAAFDRARAKKFANDREDLSLIRDPAEKEKATNERAAQLEQQAKDLQTQIDNQKAAVAKERQSFFYKATAAGVEQHAASKKELENLEKIQESLTEEAKALKETVDERSKNIEALKAENAAKDKSDAFVQGLREEVELLKASKEQRFAIEAAKNAVGDQRSEAEALLRERDALLEKADAQKKADAEAERAKEKEKADAERIADFQQKEIQRLEQRRIEIEQGKEAAKAYALQQQGLDEETAKKLAAREAELDQREAMAKTSDGTTAKEGRLLTRGDGMNLAKQQLDEAKKTRQAQEEANQKLELIYQESKKKGVMLETVVVN